MQTAADPENENPGALAGATGAIKQTNAFCADDTAGDAVQTTPMCANCRWSLRYRGDLGRHGCPLDLKHPAFVRMCWLHSGQGQAVVQLVNTFWSCKQWEGRA